MLTAHELYIALRPSTNGTRRDISVQPEGAADARLYMRQASAWRWLNEYRQAWKDGVRAHTIAASTPFHPGYVLELHLDQLFQCDQENPHDGEPRFVFHEQMLQEHASLAARYQDGRATTLLDANDLAVLRAAAARWLAANEGADRMHHKHPAGVGLASVLRALIGAGKLGGGR